VTHKELLVAFQEQKLGVVVTVTVPVLPKALKREPVGVRV
jgi:hypothetical protein